jgi:putative flavoprotein involved in K+ transport
MRRRRPGPPTRRYGASGAGGGLWCTGFRPDFGWIDLPVFDGDGLPLHRRGVVEGEPGLYFLGLWFLSAFTSSLLGGVGRDAEHIAGQIVSRHRDGRPAASVPV